MLGLVLALVVAAIVVALLGGWIFGIVIGAVALILFVLFLTGFARRPGTREARGP
jgi:hypothetical protein